MENTETSVIQLLICGAILCLFLIHPWVRRVASIGLPLCYIISLGMIHWIGALVHVVPVVWQSVADPYTLVGFTQAFWGTLAFTIGSFVVAPVIMTFFLRGESIPAVQAPDPDQLHLTKAYLIIGIVSFAVLAPLFRSIPSIGAVIVNGIYLIVVGLCLACWTAYLQRDYLKFVAWMLAACLLPLITIVTIGFVGFGTTASLLVITFVATYYRPYWQTVAALGLLIFLGLSLFVTYARDRETLRKSVWGGANYTERMDKMTATFSDFEFIDLQNPRHLAAIDRRLNQNYLVGRVINTIESGQEPFANGATLYEACLALVPRILWPDKPVMAGSGHTVALYTRIDFDMTTSIGIGQVMEFYINFGTAGVLAGFFIMGILVRIGDTMAALHLYQGNWQGFMSWFVPSMSLLNVGGSLVEVFGTTAASIVLVVIVNRILGATKPASAGGTHPGMVRSYPGH